MREFVCVCGWGGCTCGRKFFLPTFTAYCGVCVCVCVCSCVCACVYLCVFESACSFLVWQLQISQNEDLSKGQLTPWNNSENFLLLKTL